MNHSQRLVLILYCLAVALCCVRVPWRVTSAGTESVEIGYHWLWATDMGGPDFLSIGIHILAVTAIAGALFLLAGAWTPSNH